jgi:uncharacterized membrane protein
VRQALELLKPPAIALEKTAPRLSAIDWLRGLVMVLMTIDHAAGAFNAGHLMTDAAFMYKPGTPLEPAQFATRWVTHLCAPTFVFLAGLSLAISAEKRRTRREPERGFDRYLVTRGLLIAVLDPLWMSLILGPPGRILLQVLYAIGLSFVCMAWLRRVPRGILGAFALAVIVWHEALAGLAMGLFGGTNAPLALILTGGQIGRVLVAYPLVPWLAIMALGYALGGLVVSQRRGSLARGFAVAGVVSLAVFAAVRGLNGYGNMRLYRDDGSLVQWLHVSKYPPGLSFATLELGLMALLFALLLKLPQGARALRPLELLGQTAFFFYVLHAHLLEAAARLLGLHKGAGLLATYVSAAVVVGCLSPLCVVYRRYKAAHPDGWTRYL